MKKKNITIFIIATLLLVTCGCVRTQVPVANGVVGQVIDIETEEPIPNAQVYFTDYPENKSSSDEKGIFELRTHFETKWVPPLPIDFVAPDVKLTVIGGDGYETKVVPPSLYREVVIELKKSDAPYRKN